VFTPEERRSALDRLARFGARDEFREARTMAEVVFWAAWLARRSTEDAARAMKLDQSWLAFAEWFAFDYEHPGGRTLVESLLQREGDRLRTGERRYLERMRLSQIRPYEVTHVRPEEGLDLRDLWTRKIVRVRERLATRDVVQWDLVVTRVVLGPDGVPTIEGRLELLPATEAEPVLKRLRREHREFKRRVPEAYLVTFFKRVGMVYHHVWLDTVALRPMPTLLTAEGDAIVVARVIFDVLDPPALSAALARHPDLVEQDDGSYAWLEASRATRSRVQPPARRGIMITSETWRPGSDDVRRGVGTFVLARGRIVFETMSKARAERGRRLLEEIAGAAVKFRATRYETMASAMETRKGAHAQGTARAAGDRGAAGGRAVRAPLPRLARSAVAGARRSHAARGRAPHVRTPETDRAAQAVRGHGRAPAPRGASGLRLRLAVG
jgi:hypothetical protein